MGPIRLHNSLDNILFAKKSFYVGYALAEYLLSDSSLTIFYRVNS